MKYHYIDVVTVKQNSFHTAPIIPMATSGGGGGGGVLTAVDAESSQAQLMKLPRNLLAMTSTIKNTESVLEQMPQVISSLDTHVERGLQCLPHLDTVVQLLSNMQNNQLKPLSRAELAQQDFESSEQDSQVT
ncbi:tobamovirus multiplication 2B [Perilla frutescens var. frutescens]|nr:tobamovirus multiplication 2B [Perilla frutescens var. frutescens]